MGKEVVINYLVFDVETTGLDAKTSALVQLAAIPVINGQPGEPFVSYVRPHKDATISLQALEVNKLTVDQLWSFPEASEVIPKFVDWVDSHDTKFALLGHNVKFDRKFLYSWMNRNIFGMEYITRFRTIDFCTWELAKAVFKGKRNRPEKMNLAALCKFFDIPLLNAHDALCDIEATYEVFLKLKAMQTTTVPLSITNMSHQEKRRKYLDSRYIQFNEDGSFYGQSTISKDPEAARFIAEELFHLWGS